MHRPRRLKFKLYTYNLRALSCMHMYRFSYLSLYQHFFTVPALSSLLRYLFKFDLSDDCKAFFWKQHEPRGSGLELDLSNPIYHTGGIFLSVKQQTKPVFEN